MSCNWHTDKSQAYQTDDDAVSEQGSVVSEVNFDLNGTWGLINYFDSIVEHKQLAKYRIQPPSWFALVLTIENDSLKSYGSIERGVYSIEKSNDTLLTLSSDVSGDKWFLIAEDGRLKLKQGPNAAVMDTTVYFYRKRDGFKNFMHEKEDFYTIGNGVTEYFNRELFSGDYVDMKTNDQVIFSANGQLSAIFGFDRYNVRNYFGTLHPHKNLDVITFSNSQSREFKEYNWKFSKDELILTEFVPEMRDYKGELTEGDDFVLGKKTIRLKTTKKNALK